MSTEFDRELYGYRHVEVRRGDTLQKIAARELGDASRWYELITINGLLPPFISNDGGDRIAKPGQIIKVPAPTRASAADVDPERVFLSDMSLTRGRLDVSNGDFAVVSGRANLRQALQHRVDTERGELLYHQEYGSQVKRMLGAVAGPTAALLSAQYAKAAVEADPRIREVSRSVAEVVGDTTRISVTAEPVSGGSVDVDIQI